MTKSTTWFNYICSLLAASLFFCCTCNIADAQLANIGLNFTGTSLSQSGFRPPDSMGTVGPDHIVEMINGRYRVYNKSTGSILENRSLNGFWNAYGEGFDGSFAFDPRVQYDPVAERFYATSVDNSGSANNLLFAVSNSTNPLDGWTGFKVDADSDNVHWADFPQMGFSRDAVVVTANMFRISGQSGDSFENNMLILPKSDLLAPTPSIDNATLLQNQDFNVSFDFALQPAIDVNSSQSDLLTFSGDNSFIGVSRFRNLDTGSPFVRHVEDVRVRFFNDPPLAQQPGTQDVLLDSGGNRLRSAITLNNGFYYGIQGVRINNRAGLRWFQIDADTLDLEAEGTITDSELDLIYASIAVNEFGDIVVGMTGTGNNQFPSSYAIVGDTDDMGEITFGDLQLLKAGVAEYDTDVNGRNRWGDYSATVVDPSDPFTFWTFQEFASGTNQWSTQITEIRVIPEPSAWLLLVSCAICFCVWKRRVA